MNSFYKENLNKLAQAGILQVIFSPVICLFKNPAALVQSLKNCLVLLRKPWSNYLSFNAASSFLKCFYLTQAFNLEKYGILGTSPLMGDGRFKLSYFWYQSQVGVRVFKALGLVAIVFGMAAFWLELWLWLDSPAVHVLNAILILSLAPISSVFLGNLLDRQNYNVLGWMFFPLALWSLLTGHYFLLALTALAISIFSITVFVVVMGFTIVVGAMLVDFLLFLSLTPALVKWTFDFISTHMENGKPNLANLSGLLSAIGASKGIPYRRPRRIMYPAILSLFFLSYPATYIFYGQPAGQLSVIQMTVLLCLPPVWFFSNQSRLFRFADVQSILLVNLACTSIASIHSPSLILTTLFWVINTNPLIHLILLQSDHPFSQKVVACPVSQPFDLAPYFDEVDHFLDKLSPGAQIFLANNNPEGDYNNLYDGYLVLYELLFYRCSLKGLTPIPDFYFSVLKPNPLHWGQSPEAIRKSLDEFNASFVLIYSREGDAGIDFWGKAGFVHLSSLPWKQFEKKLKFCPVFEGGFITWHLFERERNQRNPQ
ncbi:MAG: hypothetical protein ACE5EK_00085 [Nitrospinales bacterium]